ncbi:hypothetical protein GUITHDRAFT_107296 [Guillardia theta CCMP2712]|uniref:Uncharacterized protein n=2 Tax=Guillardia theta TaxID=55529 RepID=L1JFM0_GUITC|nr:hypothetical protein GUITHDRAFT_107296 [Guillardia theta CCMP2712]EKX46944.1 hypothetical protein GUITHDRAFT_107296 [Guillardia theta CCMP2712]|mmetsp:Transcript_5547/g.19502  ORF Transcript_5547/g.19502 Transcript_5547/m.19502 type:complete len:210 (+) Transcript_5547:247-876(+)|eukprot:XP_005833924.1 hypothetical protein GUITHDRAFT_107296 [Guillardia theta CCMP2712]
MLAETSKNELHNSWIKQRIDERNPWQRRGESSDERLKQRLKQSLKGPQLCESTRIPGITWGELLSKENSVDSIFEAGDKKLILRTKSSVSYSDSRNLSKEERYLRSLRFSSRHATSQQRWNDSKICDIFNKYPRKGAIQQQLYRDKTLSRTSSNAFARPDKNRSAFLGVQELLEDAQRVIQRTEGPKKLLLVTGGSWEMSRQMYVSKLY